MHTLDLDYCPHHRRIGARVLTLIIKGCTGITDVSALGGVRSLDLSFCRRITDVSPLGGVYTLFLCD